MVGLKVIGLGTPLLVRTNPSAPPARLELATSGFEVHYSIRLSYGGGEQDYTRKGEGEPGILIQEVNQSWARQETHGRGSSENSAYAIDAD